MKRITILLLTAAMAIGMSGAAPQEHQVATLEVTYRYEYAMPHIDSIKYRSDDMLLQVAPDESRYFSIKTEFYDSLYNSPGGADMIRKMSMDALINSGGIKYEGNAVITSITVDREAMKDVPRRGVRGNVYKYPNQNEMTLYDCLIGSDDVCYTWTVPMDEIEWMPGDSTATILGYECQNAVADYHGRRWVAWYAPDIPVSEGPWQLCGLPGLILSAESDGGEYRFTATGVNECESPIKDRPGKHTLEKCDRKDFRRLEADVTANPGKGYGVVATNAAKIYHDLIETDYK